MGDSTDVWDQVLEQFNYSHGDLVPNVTDFGQFNGRVDGKDSNRDDAIKLIRGQ